MSVQEKLKRTILAMDLIDCLYESLDDDITSTFDFCRLVLFLVDKIKTGCYEILDKEPK